MGPVDVAFGEALRSAFRGSEVLADLEPRLDELLPAVQRRRLAPGEVLFDEGDEALDMYVVVSGAVQVFGATFDGREAVLRRLGPGTAFGEQAVLTAAPGRRTAGVRGAEPTMLARLERDAFRRVLATMDVVRRRLAALGERNVREQLARRSQLVGAFGSNLGGVERTIPAGEVLFRHGDAPDRVYLVLAGTAAAYREENGGLVRVAWIEAGRCIGELAFLRRARRSATVVAETDLRVFEVDGRRFVELLASSPELAEQMRAMERVYQLPTRGVVTQHTGRVLGEDAITTLYHLDDGRQFAASRIVAGDVYHLARTAPSLADDGAAVVERHQGTELTLDGGGAIVAITARGDWPDLAGAHLLAIDGIALSGEDREAFSRTGRVAAAAAAIARADLTSIVCTCVHITRDAVEAAIGEGCTTVAALRQALSCATVCGACAPRLSVLLGQSAWTAVRVVEETRLTPLVRSLRLRPLRGKPRPWQPGHHIAVAARIRGRWIERPYTLCGHPSSDSYEIVVRKEPEGLFSRWLFEERRNEDELRVSGPHGSGSWPPNGTPSLCFVAGIGVTPALAACRALTARPLQASLHIDYSEHSRREMACVEELGAARGVSLVTRETGREGRLAAADVRATVAAYPDAHAYVCGPPGYLLDVGAYLRAAGLPPDRIHIEVFAQAGAPVVESLRPKWMPRARQPAAPARPEGAPR